MDELIFLNKNKLVLPFLTLQQVYHNLDQSKLPAIKLLYSVENALSSDENKALTLSVMVFCLWGYIVNLLVIKKWLKVKEGNVDFLNWFHWKKDDQINILNLNLSLLCIQHPTELIKTIGINFLMIILKNLKKGVLLFTTCQMPPF